LKKYDNLVIELIGVPCSGKSSSQEIMIDALQKEYPDIKKAQEAIDSYTKNLIFVRLSKIFPSFISNFIFSLVKSFLMFYYFLLSFQSHSILHKRELVIIFKNKQRLRGLYSYIGKLGRRSFIKNKIPGTILLDEGATQLVYSLFLREDYSDEIDYNEIEYYLNHFPLPDMLYHFPSPSVEEIIKRLKSRGLKRLNKYINRINSNNKDINLVIVNNFVEKSIQIQSNIIKILNKKNFPLYSSETLIKGLNND
tara:strand:- start:4931 stop:5686 length:756 start_codon:yes stop_codon:yes gene_type:complete